MADFCADGDISRIIFRFNRDAAIVRLENDVPVKVGGQEVDSAIICLADNAAVDVLHDDPSIVRFRENLNGVDIAHFNPAVVRLGGQFVSLHFIDFNASVIRFNVPSMYSLSDNITGSQFSPTPTIMLRSFGE